MDKLRLSTTTTAVISATISLFLLMPLNASAQTFQNTEAPIFLTRGEIVDKVVAAFDLKNKNSKFIGDCWHHLSDCFFVFNAMSNFDDISYKPLLLYPDVTAANRYYDAINTATMLGLAHGYLDEKKSPFHPQAFMSRIEALKVMLGAAHLMDWREKFELVASTQNTPNPAAVDGGNTVSAHQWWYPRYLNFALDNGIIDHFDNFDPDSRISEEDFNAMLTRVLEKAKSSGV